jgi:hypothetical protein
LPDWAKKPIESLKNKVDDFFKGNPKLPKGAPEPPKIRKVRVGKVDLPATTELSIKDKLYNYLRPEPF